MKVKERLGKALTDSFEGETAGLQALVRDDPTMVRHLLGFTYSADDQLRAAAVRGLALAARWHPRVVQEAARRLVWAMNDESGTNALTAPQALEELAYQVPELLLPLVPDLMRLAQDPGLREGLVSTLEELKRSLPGQVGEILGEDLNRRLRQGESFERKRKNYR